MERAADLPVQYPSEESDGEHLLQKPTSFGHLRVVLCGGSETAKEFLWSTLLDEMTPPPYLFGSGGTGAV